MVGCSGGADVGVGGGASSPGVDPPVALHEPEILNLTLSIDSAVLMQGGGNVSVTAELEVADAGSDIETLTISQSDGTIILNFDVSGMVDDTTGIISQTFDISTTEVGQVTIRVQLFDAAGIGSLGWTEYFVVNGDPFKWYERLNGLPNTLNDVAANVADGAGFVAVGDGGTIMTSDDGLTWSNELSPVDIDLNYVNCNESAPGLAVPGLCFAAGDAGTILVSPNDILGNETWSIWFDGPDDVSLHMHDNNPFLGDIAVGTAVSTDVACILHGDFRNEAWTMVEPLAQSGHYITDLDRRALDVPEQFVLQYVATVDVPFPEQAKVLVSNDLLTWVEVLISDEHGSTYSIMGDWVSGSGGKMYESADGINWTQYQTPATQAYLVAMDGHDGLVMAHGFNAAIGMGEQLGVATVDGGETWRMFVIGAAYEPRGLAYNGGRWVSVGQSLIEPGKGAIFTTE
jgi:hypothetical protein